ncbi:Protein of unknown function [Gryllus bimaculatus]|nr:Protein of unknown function [Gryllus bimaculatus]
MACRRIHCEKSVTGIFWRRLRREFKQSQPDAADLLSSYYRENKNSPVCGALEQETPSGDATRQGFDGSSAPGWHVARGRRHAPFAPPPPHDRLLPTEVVRRLKQNFRPPSPAQLAIVFDRIGERCRHGIAPPSCEESLHASRSHLLRVHPTPPPTPTFNQGRGGGASSWLPHAVMAKLMGGGGVAAARAGGGGAGSAPRSAPAAPASRERTKTPRACRVALSAKACRSASTRAAWCWSASARAPAGLAVRAHVHGEGRHGHVELVAVRAAARLLVGGRAVRLAVARQVGRRAVAPPALAAAVRQQRRPAVAPPLPPPRAAAPPPQRRATAHLPQTHAIL